MTDTDEVLGHPGGAGADSFPIEVPLLSRGTADRDEGLRDPARVAAEWSRAQVIPIDDRNQVAVERTGDGTRLVRLPATGVAPPSGGVLLGRDGDRDVWAIPGDPGSTGHPLGGLRDLATELDDMDAGLLTAAVSVLTWHRNGGYCPRCGRASEPHSAGWARMCPDGHEEFPRTDPAVIVLVHDGADRMVLARQPSWPEGRFSVLAGFVEGGESLEGTVLREIHEEVGLTVERIGYLGSQPWPFPRSLMCGFAAYADPSQELRPRPGEMAEARWVDRATIRRVLEAGGSAEGLTLPGAVSIARRMIEGWVSSGRQ
jgi:NAD+ diphosphatase